MSGGLYGGDCQPIDAGLPPLDGPGGVFQVAPLCRIIYDLDAPGLAERHHADLVDVDLIYVVPADPGPHRIASPDLARLLACLDRGGLVGLVGSHEPAIADAADAITAMRAGWSGSA